MAISKIAFSGLMNKGSLDKTTFKKMALCIYTWWLYIISSLFFIAKLVALHIFRIKKDSSSKKDDSCVVELKDSKVLDPLIETTELEEREEEASTFCFKFEHQFKVDPLRTSGDIPSTTTETRKYCFLPSNDLSGFVDEPAATAFYVQESIVECKEDNTDIKEKLGNEFTTRFLPFKQFNGFRNFDKLEESKDVVLHENKILDEKILMGSDTNSLDEKILMGSDTNSLDEKDSEAMQFRNKFWDEKTHVDSETILFDENRILDEKILMGSDTNSLDEKDSEAMQFRNKLWDEKTPVGSETNLLEENNSSSIMEEAEAMMFHVQGSYNEGRVDNINDKDKLDAEFKIGFLLTKDFKQLDTFMKLNEEEKSRRLKDKFLEEELPMSSETSSLNEKDSPYGARFLSEGFSGFDSDSDSVSLNDDYSVKELIVDSESDCFLSERELDEHEHEKETDSTETSVDSNGYEAEPPEGIREKGLPPKRGFYGPNIKSEEKPQTLQRIQFPCSKSLQTDLTNSGDDSTRLSSSNEVLYVNKPEVLSSKEKAWETDSDKSNETHEDDLDSEDLYELESLFEHEDLIEQLKMELKRVKGTGLPTIYEESESPKTLDDLKPWKIDEKSLHEDPLDELHKFYKSYKEKMRKLDILNYQKMYAIGFLQLKDPLRSMGSQKPLIPTVVAHLSQSFWPFNLNKTSNDPSENFLKGLQNDLEAVYFGQTCLSWEFIHWQYVKARGFMESEAHRSHRYNHVAGEFQQFQVIIQRFVENESFQGPRLPNYVKNRCVLRNLLQVPVIKKDSLKDKKEEQSKGNYAITSEMLLDIMEESIRVFWEFVKADKNENTMILRGLIGAHVELQDPSDFELMRNVRAILHKKEKKLKDIQRTGNCLIKKFKKPREDRSNQDLFFSQVDLRLVSMVLKMSRITTEQLVWCYKKLNSITFVDRKVKREPSFLLFPC